MTSNAHPSSARSRRRGTRGFAAFVTAIAGFVSLAVGAVVLPATSLDSVALNWLVPLAIAFGIAPPRRRSSVSSGTASGPPALTGYLAAIGIGVAAFGLLVTITGLDPFGATSSLPAHEARAEGLGLFVWMIGLWLVAARFAIRGVLPTGRPAGHSAGLAAAAA